MKIISFSRFSAPPESPADFALLRNLRPILLLNTYMRCHTSRCVRVHEKCTPCGLLYLQEQQAGPHRRRCGLQLRISRPERTLPYLGFDGCAYLSQPSTRRFTHTHPKYDAWQQAVVLVHACQLVR